MNNAIAFIKKVLYAIAANILSLVVSLLMTLLMPKFFGDAVEQYGYFQIYWFYVSYIGFFHFGLCDGILLRDGGKHYENLSKPLYSSQFWIFTITELVIAACIIVWGILSTSDQNSTFIYIMFGVNVIVYMPRTILQYYLQATNRVKEYALITGIGRSTFGIFLILLMVLGPKNYRFFVCADVAGKTLALFVALYACRDIIISKPGPFRNGLQEFLNNIFTGSKLMFANVASMLITGIVRWGIQQEWDVSTFGKISFTLSVSNLFLVFLNAVAVVLYPTLRRTETKALPCLYSTIRCILMTLLLGVIAFYYPIERILAQWLPQYAEELQYMAILFPLCVYAAKMSMLVQTYMQVFRMEKTILRVNIIGVCIAAITTLISVFLMHNLTVAIFTILINQVFRCIYAEIELSHFIKIDLRRSILEELALTAAFVFGSWVLGGWHGCILYFVTYLVYLFLQRKQLSVGIKAVRKVLLK